MTDISQRYSFLNFNFSYDILKIIKIKNIIIFITVKKFMTIKVLCSIFFYFLKLCRVKNKEGTYCYWYPAMTATQLEFTKEISGHSC